MPVSTDCWYWASKPLVWSPCQLTVSSLPRVDNDSSHCLFGAKVHRPHGVVAVEVVKDGATLKVDVKVTVHRT